MSEGQSGKSQLLPAIQAEGGSNIIQNRGEPADYVKKAALRLAPEAALEVAPEAVIEAVLEAAPKAELEAAAANDTKSPAKQTTQEPEPIPDNDVNLAQTPRQILTPHPPPKSKAEDTRVIPAKTTQCDEHSEEDADELTVDSDGAAESESEMDFDDVNRNLHAFMKAVLNIIQFFGHKPNGNIDEHIMEIKSIVTLLTENDEVLFESPEQHTSSIRFLTTSLENSLTKNQELYKVIVEDGAWFKLIINMTQRTLLEAERCDRTGFHTEQLDHLLVNLNLVMNSITNGTYNCRDSTTMQITFDHLFDWIFCQLSSDNLFTRELKKNKEDTSTSAFEIGCSLLASLHNFSYFFPSCIPAMKEKGLLSLARKFRETTLNLAVQAQCLLIIAFVFEEGSDKKLMVISEVELKKLIRLLDDKIDNSTSSGYLTEGLIDGIKQIAVNDTNKSKLIDNGILPLLVKCLQSDEHAVQAAAARAIHTLAFTDISRQKIVSEPDCMEGLRAIKSSVNMEARNAAAGALWELEEKANHDKNTHNTPSSSSSVKHIMLSYNHLAQQEVLAIKERLDAEGYAVWFDEEKIAEGDSTLDAMAYGIENSSLVLMFYSEAYRNSANCRSEAKYAHRQQKTILPVLVQSKYTPDGWLALVVDDRYYYDITKTNAYEKVVSKLLKDIKSKVGGQQATTDEPDRPRPVTTFDREAAMVATPKTSSPVRDADALECYTWTPEQVDEWMSENGLDKFRDRTQPMDGKMLSELVFLSHSHPDTFYSLVQRSADPQELSFWNLATFGYKVSELYNRRV